MYYIFTGNRFNQVLIFDNYKSAFDWAKAATRWTDSEIAENIKTPRKTNCGYMLISE